jgi:beta-lactamase class A
MALIILAVVVGLVTAHLFDDSKQPANSPVTVSQPAKVPLTSTGQPAQTNQLQQLLDNWVATQPAQYAVSVRQLSGAELTANYRSTVQMTTASTYKLFVAYAILDGVEHGSYSMSQVTVTGEPTETVSYCLQQMILVSDNDCSYDLMAMYGFTQLTAFIQAHGFTSTNLDNYDSSGNLTNANKLSTAADEADFLDRLQAGQLLDAQDTNYLLNLMKNQQLRESIPSGVPAGIAVADKPGWLSNVETDAAIVYGPNSNYILVIMSNGSSTQPLANLSKIVYDYLENGVVDPLNTQADNS